MVIFYYLRILNLLILSLLTFIRITIEIDHKIYGFRQMNGNVIRVANLLAERAGFEPALRKAEAAFRERYHKPLGHLSLLP
jgi:hypothetical protein